MIYIHIPFCRSFCTYCGFYSEAVPDCRERKGRDIEQEKFLRYVRELCGEAGRRSGEIRATMPSDQHPEYEDTMYAGGGTPSVLSPVLFSELVAGVNRAVWGEPVHRYSEFTVEVNPEDICEKGETYVSSLLGAGVDRISMGVQSFDDNVLRRMNRRHDSSGAVRAFGVLRNAGVGNISIDLIFGFRGLSGELWRKTVEEALALNPEHISAYQLSVDSGSILARRTAKGENFLAPEDRCRSQYDLLCSMLAEAGYHHYEVSNFARPGFEAKHNSAYWKRVPYAGLGAGAHSALPDFSGEVVERKWNSEEVDGYVSDGEKLTEEDIRTEKIMLGLRTDRGVDSSLIQGDAAAKLLAEGALEWCTPSFPGRLRIPENRFFVSDEIIAELV